MAWKRLGVLASEMESAALFVASAHLGVRCGAVLHVVWNQERAAAGIREESSTDTDGTLRIALEAISSLSAGQHHKNRCRRHRFLSIMHILLWTNKGSLCYNKK